MRSKTNTDLKVGITVLTGIIVLLLGIAWAKGWHIGSTSYPIHAHFPTAGGIEKGDPVFVRGISHGSVTAIQSPSGQDVDLTLELDQPDLLHKNATASIMMLELMSGKKVEIEAGTSGKFDPVLDTIRGTFEGDLSTLIAVLSSVSKSFPTLTHNVDSVLGIISDFFGSGALKKKTYATMDNAVTTLGTMQSMLTENRGAFKRTIDQADVLTKELNRSVVPGAEGLLDSTRDFIHRAGRTLVGADSLLASLNAMLANKQSFLYKITTDPAFASRFDSLLITGHKLIEQIRFDGVNANIRFFNSAQPVK